MIAASQPTIPSLHGVGGEREKKKDPIGEIDRSGKRYANERDAVNCTAFHLKVTQAAVRVSCKRTLLTLGWVEHCPESIEGFRLHLML